MIARFWVLAIPLVLLAVPLASATGSHYVPRVGDGFHFMQTAAVTDGVGNYTGYSDSTFVNGTMAVTAVQPNGTESAAYAYANSFRDNSGHATSWTEAGSFTFSAVTFLYVQGTDNQTGYTNPYVWFYMDNSLIPGAGFHLLNTPFAVLTTSFSYPISSSSTGYVATIYGQGSGSYQRNDAYGVFTASYTWQAYFDPGTGYIVGYIYNEQDRDSSGNGFTYTDTLSVTSTTYPLTAASAPPMSSPPLSVWILVGGAIVAVLVVVLIIVLLVRTRRRQSTLPAHATQGTIAFTPAIGPPPPPGAPPPIHLTPQDQPAVQQIVLKETVKVNCRFCGTLIDSTDTVCPKCGAPRT